MEGKCDRQSLFIGGEELVRVKKPTGCSKGEATNKHWVSTELVEEHFWRSQFSGRVALKMDAANQNALVPCGRGSVAVFAKWSKEDGIEFGEVSIIDNTTEGQYKVLIEWSSRPGPSKED